MVGRERRGARAGRARIAAAADAPADLSKPRTRRSASSQLADGLANPWSLAWLPNGDLLITERAGRLRVFRDGKLDPAPIAGTPEVKITTLGGLLEVLPHPKFADNGFLYLTYSKGGEGNLSTTALARGKLVGKEIRDLKDIFVAKNWSNSPTNFGGRMVFGRDGMLYLTVGERQEPERAQNTLEHGGKVLRLNDDGTAPPDNPFAGNKEYLPEIYSVGHRSPQGLVFHPVTGALWENEHGPLGGDEINVVQAGKNYGWPLVTYGRDYDGKKISDLTARPDLEAPFIYFVPSIAISGMTFYTGDKLAAWKGNAFVGSMMEGRTKWTGHVQAHHVQRRRPADPARARLGRAPAADPRRADGARRAALRADRSEPRRAAADRAGRVAFSGRASDCDTRLRRCSRAAARSSPSRGTPRATRSS